MAEEIDHETRRQFIEGFSEWNVGDGIVFKEQAAADLRKHCSRITQPQLANMLLTWFSSNQKVTRVKETGEEWSKYREYYFQVVMTIGGIEMFVELHLNLEHREGPPRIVVLSFHPSRSK
jgi:hypothetical protein